MDIKRLQFNDSSYIEFSKRMNRYQRDGFSSVHGRTNGTIKLAMAACGGADFLHCRFTDSI